MLWRFLPEMKFEYFAHIGDLLTGIGTLVLSVSAFWGAYSWKEKNRWEKVFTEVSQAKQAIIKYRQHFYTWNMRTVVQLIAASQLGRDSLPSQNDVQAHTDKLANSLAKLQDALIVLDSVTSESGQSMADEVFGLITFFKGTENKVLQNIINFEPNTISAELMAIGIEVTQIKSKLEDVSLYIAKVSQNL
ncbi:hypothetical protein [Photobacterium carnosum]|uniref:Uncharacterized protein n=1 Tax=Photobacterium carnosum TaxID=2023717 RepID=A0A2N4URP5_9GAMM|nr:hypothetical protein [Photobacterium carnosum]PLC57681.1 hypothetical protein CIK00_11600 [Photobacterium carnosum]